MSTSNLSDQLAGYSLTTAEILYRMPDHPSLLQSYVWQDYDLAPRFPRLCSFLDFWSGNLEGSLFRIRVAHARMLSPRDLLYRSGELSIN